MDEMERLERRIEALEARVHKLERKNALLLSGGVTKNLHEKYPTGMTKSRAAELLDVTRATVYSMLRDGRLKENALGRVTGESVESLVQAQADCQGRYRRRTQ